MKEQALNFEKKGLTAVYITALSSHGLLPHRHTLGTEPTLLHDLMAHTQVLRTAGWSHIQLPLTCVNINT